MGNRSGDVALDIRSRGEAERVAASFGWFSRPQLVSVDIAIEGVDDRRAAVLGDRIRRLSNDCGCVWGETALLCGLIFSWLVGIGWGWGVGVCAGAAVVGKLAGLAWSRHRLVRLLRRLAAAPPR